MRVYTYMSVGIYRITCLSNQKVYVGSSRRIEKRIHRHKDDLRSQSHHCQYLQRCWQKYGESNFLFETIEICEENSLIDREQYWLDTYHTQDKLLNGNLQAYGTKGRAVTEKTRLKLSLSHIGKKQSKETCLKRSLALRGENHYKAKLTEQNVSDIKKELNNGTKQTLLAARYSVTRTTICEIKHGKSWSWVQ